MAQLQYIGARYVPKFYENSLDPSSMDWESGVGYEPLTVVTYNSDTYTSKVPVPSAVGAPDANPNYWAKTADYNAALVALQNAVNQLNTDVENISYYATPEMYGAVGDGVTDDTTAVQAALDANRAVLLSKIYLITDTININGGNILIGSNRDYAGLKMDVDKLMINGNDISYWKVINCKLDKSAANNHFHIEASGEFFEIDNCVLINGVDNDNDTGGIKVRKSTQTNANYCGRITNNRLQFSNIDIAEHTDGLIQGNYIWCDPLYGNNSRYAVILDMASSWIITNNQIVPGKAGGVYITRSTDGYLYETITDNFFDGSSNDRETGVFIKLENISGGTLIINNRFWSGYSNSITMDNCNYIQIENNSFMLNNRSHNFTAEIDYSYQTYGNRHLITGNMFASDATSYDILQNHNNDKVIYDNNYVSGYTAVASKFNYANIPGVITGINTIDGRTYSKHAGIVSDLGGGHYGIYIERGNQTVDRLSAIIDNTASNNYSYNQVYNLVEIYSTSNTDVGHCLTAIVGAT